jgi:hypothetical protein
MRKGTSQVWGVLVTLIASSALAQPAAPEWDRLVRSSSLIFIGTIEKLGTAKTTQATLEENTAVVTVEEVYTPTGGLGDLRKRGITVLLDARRPAKAGERALFFANGVAYGAGVVVREVERLPVTDKAALEKEIAAALTRRDDRALAQRIARSSLVVVGKVVSVREAQRPEQPAISEHDPRWFEAVVELTSVERGQFSGKDLTILFPASADELWAEAPKFKVGQEGVFILQKDQTEIRPPGPRRLGYTALNPLDFQPNGRIDQVRRLVK